MIIGENMPEEVSDTREQIDRASQASGARKMLEDLAQKMRNGNQQVKKPSSIEDFYVKSNAEIPDMVNKIVDVLMKYAEKVKQKRMSYAAHDQMWYPFDTEDKDKELGEIERVINKIQRLTDRPPKDVATFNEHVRFVYKNMIMGGIEG